MDNPEAAQPDFATQQVGKNSLSPHVLFAAGRYTNKAVSQGGLIVFLQVIAPITFLHFVCVMFAFISHFLYFSCAIMIICL